MKKLLSIIILSFTLISAVYAQPGFDEDVPPPTEADSPSIPINGGTIAFVISTALAGAGFIALKTKRKK